jgi:hypothetical protein
MYRTQSNPYLYRSICVFLRPRVTLKGGKLSLGFVRSFDRAPFGTQAFAGVGSTLNSRQSLC